MKTVKSVYESIKKIAEKTETRIEDIEVSMSVEFEKLLFIPVTGKLKEIDGRVWLIKEKEGEIDEKFGEELRCLGVSRIFHNNFGVLKVNSEVDV